ncbi:hypothetical protein D779_3903 [Imhoffiella purpurea]|uniref:Uncharacterized protein n=1 Tax=Imhoffiella purpurea TaxID=1249627 RepID=W9VBB8_9GAMM|nr:hypothetical protein D779_3903 [Imhoffiella purpurea]
MSSLSSRPRTGRITGRHANRLVGGFKRLSADEANPQRTRLPDGLAPWNREDRPGFLVAGWQEDGLPSNVTPGGRT